MNPTARTLRAFACVACLAGIASLSLPSTAQQPGPAACSTQVSNPPACQDSDGDGFCNSWEGANRLPDGTPIPDANPHRPDIYVHYDYMGWADPGAACNVDADCAQGGLQPNLVCHENRCNHNHKPDPAALQIVVDSFARHGVALHIDADAHEVPHSTVTTFASDGDDDNGPRAICAGADVHAGALGEYAVSMFDLKKRYFDPALRSSRHYVVFAHSNTCTTDDTHALTGNCGQCPTDRATPAGLPVAGSSGLAELPGNDFIVSLAQSFYGPVASVPRNPYTEAGVFMHELGHNLGLHHAGDAAEPQEAPNYLSVMNQRYVLNGILQANGAGSSQLKACTTNADCSGGAVCRQIPAIGGRCFKIDYSSSPLKTLNEAALDERLGVSQPDSGLQDIILYTDANGIDRRGPAAGPVDWNGNGVIDDEAVAVDLNALNGASELLRGYNDWDHGSCRTSADCPVNGIRAMYRDFTDPTLDPHEPCVQNKCQTLWYGFQCTHWGKKD